jgi:MFS family permease
MFPCAFAHNIQTMLIARFIDGLAGSAFLSVAGGTVGDMFAKHVSLTLPPPQHYFVLVIVEQQLMRRAGTIGTNDGVYSIAVRWARAWATYWRLHHGEYNMEMVS